MKLNSVELTEFIKENYSYHDSTEFYQIQDILLLTDKLLKNKNIDKSKLLEALKEVEANER